MRDTRPEDRRNPYREFDSDLIQDFLNGRTVDASVRISAGKSNTNFRLELSDGEVVLLRLYSDAGVSSPDREAAIHKLIRGRVPVPEMLEHGSSWAIFEFVAGEPLESSPKDSSAAAAVLARLSEIKVAAGGWIKADGAVVPFDFGDEFVGAQLDKPAVLEWIGGDTADAIRKILRSEAGRLSEIRAQHVLVHGDFNPTNVLVRDGCVVAVVDWEYAHSGTPYVDIGNLLRNSDERLHPAIGQGLAGAGFALPGDWTERAALVDLGSHIEFLTSSRALEFKQSRVKLIHAFVRRFGARGGGLSG